MRRRRRPLGGTPSPQTGARGQAGDQSSADAAGICAVTHTGRAATVLGPWPLTATKAVGSGIWLVVGLTQTTLASDGSAPATPLARSSSLVREQLRWAIPGHLGVYS